MSEIGTVAAQCCNEGLTYDDDLGDESADSHSIPLQLDHGSDHGAHHEEDAQYLRHQPRKQQVFAALHRSGNQQTTEQQINRKHHQYQHEHGDDRSCKISLLLTTARTRLFNSGFKLFIAVSSCLDCLIQTTNLD